MPSRQSPFQSPNWNSDDAENLRNFLGTQTGRRLTFRLINERPGFVSAILVKGDLVNLRALEAATVQGYEAAVHNLFNYVIELADDKQEATTYPSVDDDGNWDADLYKAPLPEPSYVDGAPDSVTVPPSRGVPPALEPLPDVELDPPTPQSNA